MVFPSISQKTGVAPRVSIPDAGNKGDGSPWSATSDATAALPGASGEPSAASWMSDLRANRQHDTVRRPNDAASMDQAAQTATQHDVAWEPPCQESAKTAPAIAQHDAVSATQAIAQHDAVSATQVFAQHDAANPAPAVIRYEPADSDADSDIARRRAHLKVALHYAIAAAGCALFALIYAQFSHEVYSPFMTFMFAIPLIGGALPALCLALAKSNPLPRATRQAWGLALASLTVASCLRGIFDIAGTASPYLPAYLAAAVICAIAAVYGTRKKPESPIDLPIAE